MTNRENIHERLTELFPANTHLFKSTATTNSLRTGTGARRRGRLMEDRKQRQKRRGRRDEEQWQMRDVRTVVITNSPWVNVGRRRKGEKKNR